MCAIFRTGESDQACDEDPILPNQLLRRMREPDVVRGISATIERRRWVTGNLSNPSRICGFALLWRSSRRTERSSPDGQVTKHSVQTPALRLLRCQRAIL